jgi:hypothetical protein
MPEEFLPIHELEAALEAARLDEIKRLAAKGASGKGIPTDVLGSLAHVQLALTAVREEIAAHRIKVGGGSEKPLK